MTAITHHIPDAMLAAYAAGSLPHAFSVVVATHISMCAECRAALEAHHAVGGAVLETNEKADLSSRMKSNVLAMLDEPAPAEEPVFKRQGIYPGPVLQTLKNRPVRWKRLGGGVRQDIIHAGDSGTVRLLYIPAGQAVPDHGHNGQELTLVLQGSFSDEAGRFGVGDVECADEHLEHTPIADSGATCICLAATDAPLRFRSLVPRVLQPLFRI